VWAIEEGYETIVNLLLGAGANPLVIDGADFGMEY